MPEWIFKLKKADKRELKKLAKRYPDRATISTRPMENRDWSFRKKLDKLDVEYMAKIKNASKKEFADPKERDP